MELQVSKWGNSLALRIPSEFARRLSIAEGDTLDVRLTADGGLSLRASNWSRAAFADELRRAREAMPESDPVVEVMRRSSRY